jgi:hypothetical protein
MAVDKVAKRVAARPAHFPPAAPKRMRRDLVEVLTYLERQTAEGDRSDLPMLLSNDNMVLAWWAVLGKGTLLMPDVFSVTLTQAAIEQKLAQSGRVLGLDEDTFVTLLNDFSFNIFFYGHNQFQSSIIWHPAPLADYPPEVQRNLMKRDMDVWSVWDLALPLSRRMYLREFYRNYALDEGLLPDYVVVAQYETFPRDLVLPEAYQLTLRNENYRVWIRRN